MKRIVVIFLLVSAIGPASQACTTCNAQLQTAIAQSAEEAGLFRIFLPFILLGAVVAWLFFLNKRYLRLDPEYNNTSIMPLLTATTVIGIGVGGFIDGIVFHQIMQWHSMLSRILPPATWITKSVNMFWDGIFHAFTLLVVVTGVYMLFKLINQISVIKSGKVFWAGMLGGWGLFNILEGTLNHQLFKLHSVNDLSVNREAWNIGFLVFSLVLLLIAWLLTRNTVNKTNYTQTI